jgi:hypothetical protein
MREQDVERLKEIITNAVFEALKRKDISELRALQTEIKTTDQAPTLERKRGCLFLNVGKKVEAK